MELNRKITRSFFITWTILGTFVFVKDFIGVLIYCVLSGTPLTSDLIPYPILMMSPLDYDGIGLLAKIGIYFYETICINTIVVIVGK